MFDITWKSEIKRKTVVENGIVNVLTSETLPMTLSSPSIFF